MNYYYILSTADQGYEQVDEIVFLSMVAEKQIRVYTNKVYRGETELDKVPEELRESVRINVDERTARLGKYEDGIVSSGEALAAVEKLSGPNLTRGATKALFSGIEKLRDGATDAVASMAISVYPQLKGDGSLIKGGIRINWNGVLKRAASDLWDTIENNPDNAPTLWEDVNYKDGHRIIPSTITATMAFALDECGWWNDTLYRSKIAANTYTPDQYPASWEIVL